MTPTSKACIAIDLTSIKEGGENGGHKIAVINYLVELQTLRRFQFVLIGSPAGRADLLPLLKEGDQHIETFFPVIGSTVLIRDFAGAIRTTLWRPRFLQRLGVSLVYAPFGTIHFSEQGLPFVTWIADLLHRDFPKTLTRWQIRAREEGLTIAMRESLFVQANSQFVARRLQQSYGVSKDRLVVLPPIPQKLQRPAHLKSAQPPYFFYPANFWAHKNHEILLRAYKEYWTGSGNSPDAWSLVLTGHPGAEQQRVKALAEALGIAHRVQFLGYLAGAEYVEWFAGADCLLFPSCYEGFGMPLVEAMRLRVPIVASDAACLPEIGGDAFLPFDPANTAQMAAAMQTISTDEPLRNRLIAAGEKRQELFSETALITGLTQLLSRAAEKQKLEAGRSFATNVLRLNLLARRLLTGRPR
jgi:glycosyltransferase involved in cell wall biosynthesis